MKKSSKLSLLTAGIAGTLLATSVASVALTACATQTTPDSSQEQYNWFEKQIDWSKPETFSNLYKDNQGIYYTSSAMTTIVTVAPEFSATTITLPSSVQNIEGYTNIVDGKLIPTGAFESTGLQSIKFAGTNLTNIGPQAFKDVLSLNEISLPTSVKTIGQQAFSGCTKIETINLENVISIGSDAFRETQKLTSLTFNSESIKLNSIGNGAFMNSGLSGKLDLSLATNLYEIGSYAFSGTGLTEVVLPSSLTLLGAGAFQDSKQLLIVNLDKTQVKIIKPSTFQGCIGLKTVSFPNKLLSIGEDAFNNANTLEKLDLSNTDINTFGNNSFQDTIALKTIDLPNTDTLTVIGSGAFLNSGITRLAKKSAPATPVAITLPATVGKLGNSAFANSKITSFDMSAVTSTTLTTLPADFFNNATSLETIKLSNAIKTIGENAFAGATKLNTIDLSNTVIETIGVNAFKDATRLTTITLPTTATLKTIGNNAFTNSGLNTLGSKPSSNTTLTPNKVELPSSVTTLGTGVFSNSGVVNVDLSRSTSTTMNTLPASTFEGAENLASVTLKNGLSVIGENAFKNTTNLKTVTTSDQNTLRAVVENKVQFGNNLTTINNNAFSNSGITEVALSNSRLTEIATDVFSNASQLKTVNLPSGLKKISNGAFNNNTSLDTVNFKQLSNLETIEDNNFSNSDFSIVDLSSNTKLKGLKGDNLFTNMSQLTEVKIPSSFNTLNNQSLLTNSAGESISDKVFTKPKGSGEVKFTSTVTEFTLATGTTSIQQSEFLKEYSGNNGMLDLSTSSALTTIKQNTFNNPSISKLILPGDNNISFDLGNNVTSDTKAKDVAPIYYDAATANGKEDTLQEISYTAKAGKGTDGKLKISDRALNTILNVMNTYSSGTIASLLKTISNQQKTSESSPSAQNFSVWNESNSWIDANLTTESAKNWSNNDNGAISIPTVDITTKEFDSTASSPTLYKKHNGIIWMIKYESTLQSILLKPKEGSNIKLYKASSTTQTTKTVEYKQVYFKESSTPEKSMKVTVVIK